MRAGFASLPGAPVLILTGQLDYEIDLEATALGVTDYLVKQELSAASLERSIRYALSHHEAINSLSRSEERYALAVRAANDGIWDWDLAATGSTSRLAGTRSSDGPSRPATTTRRAGSTSSTPTICCGSVRRSTATSRGDTPHLLSEHRMRHADGSWRWVLTRGLAIRDADGRATRMAGSLSDITDRLAARAPAPARRAARRLSPACRTGRC